MVSTDAKLPTSTPRHGVTPTVRHNEGSRKGQTERTLPGTAGTGPGPEIQSKAIYKYNKCRASAVGGSTGAPAPTVARATTAAPSRSAFYRGPAASVTSGPLPPLHLLLKSPGTGYPDVGDPVPLLQVDLEESHFDTWKTKRNSQNLFYRPSDVTL